jgi:Arc/MetJ-type ribon-helix-helix transcriptional regulator
MRRNTEPITLPEDLQVFAEERVRAGQNASVAEVVYDAVQEKKLSALREAVDAGIAELDAGLGLESSVEDFIAEIDRETGLAP